MKKTTNYGLALYEKTDKMNITTSENSLNHNMELIDSALKEKATINDMTTYIEEHKDELKGADGTNGIDGKDGYTPIKGVDYFDGVDGKDGTNGKNGTDGKDGANGYTPVKGIDYFTESDIEEIAAKSAEKNPSPRKISELENDSGYLTEVPSQYVTEEELASKGYITEIGGEVDLTGYAKITDVFSYTKIPLFKNYLEETNIEYGKMLNGEGTEVSDNGVGLCLTDFIPVTKGSVIRMEDYGVAKTSSSGIFIFKADKSLITKAWGKDVDTVSYYFTNLTEDTNGLYNSFTIANPTSLAYVRICTLTSAVGKNPVLTVNEEIEYEFGYGNKLNPKVKVEYSQMENAPQKNCWTILPNEHINIAYSFINRKPINTVEHFVDAATNYKYNTLKCDVQPTIDGELVLCHDAGFTFDTNGKIAKYDSSNATMIHSVTAETCLSYSHPTGEHPCLIGDFLKVCRKYGKVAFVTIRGEYLDVVIPKLISELKKYNMMHSTIINSLTYNSLVAWRTYDTSVMVNYTLGFGANIDKTAIDKAIALGYSSLGGFGLTSSSPTPTNTCDFEYAQENGIRLIQAIAYAEGSPEECYALGYDGCQIAYPWNN